MNGSPPSGIARAALSRSVPLALSAALYASAAFAQVAPPDPELYFLAERSAYDVGCFGPCDCAVRSHPIQGWFRLRFVGDDPLYANYAVEEFSAIVLLDGKSVPVSGSGEYRIGGEVALMQELTLDLKIGRALDRRREHPRRAGT